MQWEVATLAFQGKKASFSIAVDKAQGEWLVSILQKIAVTNAELLTDLAFAEMRYATHVARTSQR